METSQKAPSDFKEEERGPSKVWLVSLQHTLDHTTPKYDKKQIGEYQPGDEDVLFPVGIVLQHTGRYGSEVFDDGFEIPRDAAAYKVWDNRDVSHLEGQLLTLAESVISDKEQREAFKSVLRQTLWRFNADCEREVREIYKAA